MQSKGWTNWPSVDWHSSGDALAKKLASVDPDKVAKKMATDKAKRIKKLPATFEGFAVKGVCKPYDTRRRVRRST